MTRREASTKRFYLGQQFKWKQYDFELTGIDWESGCVIGKRGKAGINLQFDFDDVTFAKEKR